MVSIGFVSASLIRKSIGSGSEQDEEQDLRSGKIDITRGQKRDIISESVTSPMNGTLLVHSDKRIGEHNSCEPEITRSGKNERETPKATLTSLPQRISQLEIYQIDSFNLCTGDILSLTMRVETVDSPSSRSGASDTEDGSPDRGPPPQAAADDDVTDFSYSRPEFMWA